MTKKGKHTIRTRIFEKIRQLEEQVSLLQTQLADAEKLITSLQATSLGVLEDMGDLDDIL